MTPKEHQPKEHQPIEKGGVEYHTEKYRQWREKTAETAARPYTNPLKPPLRNFDGSFILGASRSPESFTCVQCGTFNLDVPGTVTNSTPTTRPLGWISTLSDHECAFCHKMNRLSHTEMTK
jgi:hypothetical protein